MNEVAGVMLRAMKVDTMQLERIAVNLANVSTPGYAREVMVARPLQASAQGGFARLMTPPADASAPLSDVEVLRDRRVGALKTTGAPWDMALAGGVYFEVQGPAGPLYTRRGQFQLDAAGRLVTPQGWAVTGAEGELRPGQGAAQVDAAGWIRSSAGQVTGRLKLVRFEDANALRHVDAGYFSSEAPPLAVADAQAGLRQGMLEGANVSNSQEMVQLMGTMRHFESLTRALQSYDEMLGSAIKKLGEA
ncbi:MAG TPA: flagellar hook basal-body protein [Anaerolineae bacterium]|nr:flagellar hook basal-body protein [Anaerolineae bacterium]